jgi:hypothetical protein
MIGLIVPSAPTAEWPTLSDLLAVCAHFHVPVSRFGREAAGDPRLVSDLAKGRTLRPSTRRRLHAHVLQRVMEAA